MLVLAIELGTLLYTTVFKNDNQSIIIMFTTFELIARTKC